MPDFDPQISPIPYEVKNASQNTGVDTASDTVSIKAGGNTDIIKVTSTKVTINDDGDDVDFQMDGDTLDNVLYVDASANGVGMGTSLTSFPRGGATIRSAFISMKEDAANRNAGAQVLFSNETLRACDFSLLKAAGTQASPSALSSGHVISNFRWEGHDGTGFVPSAQIQQIVDNTSSSGVMPGALYFSVADVAGVLQTLLSLRSTGYIGISGRATPLSGLDLAGSIGFTRRAVSADTNTAANDVIIATTSTSAARTHTIRTADTVGRRIYIFTDEGGNAGTNNITIATEGTQKINGADTYVINTNYGSVRLYCNGTNWFTF